MEKDCIFCKIAGKKIASAVIYEDADTLAFLDIKPINPGHTLVVPKRHSRNIFEIGQKDLVAITASAQKIALALRGAGLADGINIGWNNERAAGQLVFHTHIHVMPRLDSDGYQHWKSKRPYQAGEIEMVAEKIKNAMSK